MNNQLIVKTIKYNNKSCPEIVYDNPLLDRNVARELAASFVKILRITDQNSNINSNLRHSVLGNLRKLCQNNVEHHLTINDVYIDMLNQFYNNQVSEQTNNNDAIDQNLDAFVMRKITSNSITSQDRKPSLNAEVIQALLNLNKGGIYLDKLSSDIINWNGNDSKYVNILKGLWNEDCPNTRVQYIDDVAIKMKAEIEKQLLEAIHKLLTNPSSLDNITCNDIISLINKCSISVQCFQTCCSTLNCLFIMTNYNETIEVFIAKYIQNVKSCLQEHEFAILYPLHLQSTVLLLDIDPIQLDSLPCKEQYINKCLDQLQKLHSNFKHDFILLLSHFPQWFDLYFNKNPSF